MTLLPTLWIKAASSLTDNSAIEAFLSQQCSAATKFKTKITNKTDLISAIVCEWCQDFLGDDFDGTHVCWCFLDEDGEKSKHGLLYIDLLSGIK